MATIVISNYHHQINLLLNNKNTLINLKTHFLTTSFIKILLITINKLFKINHKLPLQNTSIFQVIKSELVKEEEKVKNWLRKSSKKNYKLHQVKVYKQNKIIKQFN
jgi:molecular chaperone DnaK (HSP70)